MDFTMDHTKEIIDKMAIEDVMSKYAITIDTGDADGFAALFTKEAVWHWETLGLTFEGRQTLRQLARTIDKHIPGGQHMLSHPVIELSGNRAKTICQFTVFLSRPEKIHTLMLGRYHDDLVKKNGHWRISRHFVYVENPEILSKGEIGAYYQPLLENIPK